MKTNLKITVGVLTGIALGIAGTAALHAQQSKAVPGYFIAEVEVTDMALMKEYGSKVPESLVPFNHRYIIRDAKPISLEGEPPKGIVVIAFDSVENAQAWYNSPAYSAIRPIRERAAKTRAFIAKGVAAE